MRKFKKGKIFDYNCIILDMDGTLYYQFPLRVCIVFMILCHYILHLTKIKEVFILWKFRKLRENYIASINKDDFEEELYKKLSEYYHESLESIKKLIDYWINERPLPLIYFFRDRKLIKAIQKLKMNGIKIIVYSDYPVEKKISALKTLYVDYQFCAHDKNINCLKPDIQGIKYIIDVLRESIENILFIGDRYIKDGKCAAGVGMDYIILSRNPFLRAFQIFSMF
ncbi:conserved hypothetical protein [Treponema primitia ZAS-2]|uniref:Uncharacterized protein n=1 Tax=Treponema primitia (strain ATCC BAA-887 / DSM 12427 / ZAS-2) TaxID=545694 RepID=F5YNY7_TREPZ|nr:HAD family hydrolase [Treponema primitia]AEF85950.1 conserved hypothetical protein [Treponema primitia ZAS-2]